MTRPGQMLARHPAPSGPPAMSYVVDDLWAEYGISLDGSSRVQSWASVGGKYTPNEGTTGKRPTWAIAPSGGFNGRKVVNFEASRQDRLFTATDVPTIFSAGTRPYVAAVMAVRDFPGFGWNQFWAFENGAGNLLPLFGWFDYGNRALAFATEGATTIYYAIPEVIGTPMFVETFYTASGFACIAINRVVRFTGSQVISLPAAATKIWLSSRSHGESGTSSLAFQRACSQLPPDAERDTLYTWAQSYYAIP